MTHKDFLTEVQHRSGLDRQTSSALMTSAIKLMAEQATEQIAVEWEGIGHFVATKHPEYVAEDPESGLQTMYPPRISYRLSQQEPNTNIKELNATQFSFHLARYAKATEGDAEFFMHTVTKLILERLDANDPVEIQGLGVFSWVESQQGKRMSLQVDDKMRTLVNAPFACFEPMTIAVEAKPNPEPQPTEVVEVKPKPEPQPTEAVEPKPQPTEAVEVKPKPEPEPTPAEIAVPENANSSAISESKPKREQESTFLEKVLPLIDQLKALPKQYLYGGLVGVALLLLLLVWLLIPSKKDELVAAPAPTENVQNEVDSLASKSESEITATLSTSDSPTITESSVDPAPVKTAPNAPAHKSATKQIVASKPSNDMLLLENGQPKKDQLGDGGRLTLVALRHYGDKAFWAYIYDVNAFQLGNPNNVPIGLPLYLPDPTYFKIDASDPASIKRAQNRAMQILREWE